MKALSLPIKYGIFAGIAAVANIATQRISFAFYDRLYSLYIAMFFGTLAGLVVKYILDKRYIFYYQVKNRKEDFFKFFIYTCMGIITTFIFWGAEILFDYLFPFGGSKYIGAWVGLAVGYTSKYFLDKRFVFTQKVNEP